MMESACEKERSRKKEERGEEKPRSCWPKCETKPGKQEAPGEQRSTSCQGGGSLFLGEGRVGEKPRVKVARQVVLRGKADSQTVGRIFQANWWMPKAD
ncbi:hypothetical protein E2C01_063128 [Portunus trituberculatus]|uniref:Uncharacterized protein n=1 Tax=Portunus trituberculatus TaxID=210409 RepID=A0A5B7HHX7_PORTR|nr:hypothetical protein [Portunus trituberculatus]